MMEHNLLLGHLEVTLAHGSSQLTAHGGILQRITHFSSLYLSVTQTIKQKMKNANISIIIV
jgi:hypothetical protein